MIIASPSAQTLPPPGKVDASSTKSTGVQEAVDPSTDPTSGPADGPAQGFGTMLAQRLDRGTTSDNARAVPSDARMLFGPDGQPLATTNTASATKTDAAPIDAAALPDVAVTRPGLVDSDDDKTLPDRKDGDDTAGNDLAAQLALVSQWAALPSPTATRSPSDAKADGPDIEGKLDTVRVTSSKATPGTVAAPLGVDATPAGIVPLVASTAQQTLERTSRGASTTTAAVTKASDLKAKDDAQAVGAGDRLSLAEALLGKTDPATVHGAIDATSMASAFVTSVTAQASNAQTAAAAAATPTPSQLHEPVGTTAWSHEVGQATLRMAASDLQGASLRLNPEHLGPLDVQVRVDNGVAHLAFTAAHAETRQAIESSRTTLDQLFADQGLKIGDCAVGDSAAQRRFDADPTPSGTTRGGDRRTANGGADDTTTSTVTTTVRRALGLVDTFA